MTAIATTVVALGCIMTKTHLGIDWMRDWAPFAASNTAASLLGWGIYWLKSRSAEYAQELLQKRLNESSELDQ